MNNLVIREENNFGEMLKLGDRLVKSGFLPTAIKTGEQALAIMLTGRELGIPAMQALRQIHIIQGKPTISPELMLSMAYQKIKGFRHFVIESTEEKCTIEFERAGNKPYQHTFTIKDAMGLGLKGKDNWLKQPGTMLRWRCISAGLRIYCPDAILGTYTPEEFNAEVDTETGEIKHVESKVLNESRKDDRKEEAGVEGSEGGVTFAQQAKEIFKAEESKEIDAQIEKQESRSADKRGTGNSAAQPGTGEAQAGATSEDGERSRHGIAFNQLLTAYGRYQNGLKGDPDTFWPTVTAWKSKQGEEKSCATWEDAQRYWKNTYNKYGKAIMVFDWVRRAQKQWPGLFDEAAVDTSEAPF